MSLTMNDGAYTLSACASPAEVPVSPVALTVSVAISSSKTFWVSSSGKGSGGG